MRIIVHALPGQKDMWMEVIVISISTSESILCMTLLRLRFSDHKLMLVNSVDNVADLLTKLLTKTPFLSLRKTLLGF